MATKKLPRELLPQIPGDKIDEFIQFIEEHGVRVEYVRVPVTQLKAIQSHVNQEKIEKFKKDPKTAEKPLIISKTGWILDGHHRWLALKELNPTNKALCIRCNCPITKLVILGHQFEPSFTKTVYETAIYSRKLWDEQQKSLCSSDEPEELMVRKTLRPY